MGTVWSALLVGGGLAGALFVWLLRGGPGDKGQDEDAGQEKDAPPGEAAVPGGHRCGGGQGPGSSGQEPATQPEHLQESNGHLIAKPKDLGHLQEAVWGLQNPSREVCDRSREHVLSGHFPDSTSSETGNSGSYSEVSRNESLESVRFQKGRDTSAKAATYLSGKLPSSELPMDKAKEVNLAQLDSQDLAEHEDWEMVSRHSSWGDVGLDDSLEAPVLSMNQGTGSSRSTLVEARDQHMHGKTERAAAVSSESQQVSVTFHIHYITSSDGQFLAVTGDHEHLGWWNTYIPLHPSRDGFWSHSVVLPAATVVEWKFVLVENGAVTRWEECSNRRLQTGHKDQAVYANWGLH
ncbi:starch-binding domain-containing protein 1 [Carlito syrichta]|uniref:Starch-binding domain-containing protein 1 n=1 Tax=Carlito syrichta TaxID=1868482 RepID=A0A1U7T318_CARSF|nr:starch-binding domain-containing protein 1 [Carlito syrichta]